MAEFIIIYKYGSLGRTKEYKVPQSEIKSRFNNNISSTLSINQRAYGNLEKSSLFLQFNNESGFWNFDNSLINGNISNISLRYKHDDFIVWEGIGNEFKMDIENKTVSITFLDEDIDKTGTEVSILNTDNLRDILDKCYIALGYPIYSGRTNFRHTTYRLDSFDEVVLSYVMDNFFSERIFSDDENVEGFTIKNIIDRVSALGFFISDDLKKFYPLGILLNWNNELIISKKMIKYQDDFIDIQEIEITKERNFNRLRREWKERVVIQEKIEEIDDDGNSKIVQSEETEEVDRIDYWKNLNVINKLPLVNDGSLKRIFIATRGGTSSLYEYYSKSIIFRDIKFAIHDKFAGLILLSGLRNRKIVKLLIKLQNVNLCDVYRFDYGSLDRVPKSFKQWQTLCEEYSPFELRGNFMVYEKKVDIQREEVLLSLIELGV